MSKTSEIPYSWDEIEAQVRFAVLAQASIISLTGPAGDAVQAYIGADIGGVDIDNLSPEQIARLDVSRHHLCGLARRAYAYAYQTEEAVVAGEDDWHEVSGVLTGFPQTDLHGEPSPFSTLNDFPLRRVFETFFARWKLMVEGEGVSVRELSLLAGMTVPAVRTSLSKEGFKLEKPSTNPEDDTKSFYLNADDALVWLSRRRGFIPNRTPARPENRKAIISQMLDNADVDFPEVLARILSISGHTIDDLTQESGQDPAWVRGLFERKDVSPDLVALRSVAKALGAPEPQFVGRTITCLLARQADAE